MRTLSIDLETYSSNDIRYSVYKYVEAPDFEILLFAYAFDDDPVRVVDLAQGETLPDDVRNALYDKNVLKTAFNANFEINCLKKYFPDLPEEQWECTRILALYNSYPPHLAAVAKAMGFPEDKQKDTRGKALIRFFCLPCKPTKANGGRTRNLPADAPEKWKIFKEYNRQDVVVEMAIRKKLVALRPPKFEHDNWLVDQEINRNGIMVNRRLVENAIRLSSEYRQRLLDEAREITGLDNPNSPLQVKDWLEEKLGRPIESLSKESVKDLLAGELPSDVRLMLLIRQKISKSSVKKYDAMYHAACMDDRIRGMFQFYGAARTGRFAGRIVQLQNLRRNSMPDLDAARQMVIDGDLEALEMCYDDVQDVLSQLVRTALEAPKGTRFIVADFSAIEARVIAWLAGETWEMEAFASGKDIYCATASAMFGVPVVKHGVNGELRQKGKVAVLACLAEGQQVLTDKGLIPIEKVTKDMKVWDGQQFVHHDGVIYKGERKVITYEGLTATPDHLVWIEGNDRPVHFIEAAQSGAHLLRSGFDRTPIRVGKNNFFGKKICWQATPPVCINTMHRLRQSTMDPFVQSYKRSVKGLSALLAAQAGTVMVIPENHVGKTALRKPKKYSLQRLRWAGNKVQVSIRVGRRIMGNAKPWDSREQKIGTGSRRQQRQLRAWESALGNPKSKLFKSEKNCINRISARILALCKKDSTKQIVSGRNQGTNHPGCAESGTRKAKELARHTKTARVYDIKDAGPNHRFTVSGKLVHNCGYGGGIGALKAMGADKMGLTDDELQTVVRKWREASPHIVKLWADVENAAMNAVSGIPTTIKQKNLHFHVDGDALFIELPSGRHLVYLHPHLGKNRFGSDAIIYTGLGGSKTTTGRWGKLETYGGKCVENIVQAIARDCLCAAMARLTKAGYKICAHIHDEVILEMPEGKGSLDEAIAIMCKNAPWSEGLVMSADGFEAKYYQKD